MFTLYLVLAYETWPKISSWFLNHYLTTDGEIVFPMAEPIPNLNLASKYKI